MKSVVQLIVLCAMISGVHAYTEEVRSDIIVHTIDAPYQGKPSRVEVLLPDTLKPGRVYPVVYILPVNAGIDGRWGSGMREAVKADAANRYDAICVAPEYHATPWFANHPTDPVLQQERHFIDTVIPFIEAAYPVQKTKEGRLLLGFSKSGYGAVLLLLRHPDRFGKAVAWDAPLAQMTPAKWNMIAIFDSPEYFKQYAIPTLIERNAAWLQKGSARLFLMPNGEKGHRMREVHEQLTTLKVPHVYEATPTIEHSWSSGWLPRALALLFSQGT